MSHEEILNLINLISPHGKNYVENSFKNNEAEILYSLCTLDNKGVFVKADSTDCCIFYAAFLKDNDMDELLAFIERITKNYISMNSSKEICFNVYGEDRNIINLARRLGFKPDMYGYHMEYTGKVFLEPDNISLTIKGFESSMIKAFSTLFDSAYYKLNIDNGWELNYYTGHEEYFHKKLINLSKNNNIVSFWLGNELAGAYIIEENYITDLVVNPEFQNKGYGSYMLHHCIRNLKMDKAIDKIRLRVAESNTGAFRLYKRNGFKEIAHFAEHTL